MTGDPGNDRELAEERSHMGRMAMLQVGALLVALLEQEGRFPSLETAVPLHLGAMRKRLATDGIEVVAAKKEHRFAATPNGKVTVHIGLEGTDCVRLTSVVGPSYVAGDLRSDGVIENECFGTLLPTGATRDRALATNTEASLYGDADADHHAQSDSFNVGDFLRTIVNRASPGKAVQLLGVELYGSGTIVNYQVGPVQPEEVDAVADIGLSDNLGTTYGLAAYSKSGVDSYYCAAEFTPAVPRSASNLEVTVGSVVWRLDLG